MDSIAGRPPLADHGHAVAELHQTFRPCLLAVVDHDTAARERMAVGKDKAHPLTSRTRMKLRADPIEGSRIPQPLGQCLQRCLDLRGRPVLVADVTLDRDVGFDACLLQP